MGPQRITWYYLTNRSVWRSSLTVLQKFLPRKNMFIYHLASSGDANFQKNSRITSFAPKNKLSESALQTGSRYLPSLFCSWMWFFNSVKLEPFSSWWFSLTHLKKKKRQIWSCHQGELGEHKRYVFDHHQVLFMQVAWRTGNITIFHFHGPLEGSRHMFTGICYGCTGHGPKERALDVHMYIQKSVNVLIQRHKRDLNLKCIAWFHEYTGTCKARLKALKGFLWLVTFGGYPRDRKQCILPSFPQS